MSTLRTRICFPIALLSAGCDPDDGFPIAERSLDETADITVTRGNGRTLDGTASPGDELRARPTVKRSTSGFDPGACQFAVASFVSSHAALGCPANRVAISGGCQTDTAPARQKGNLPVEGEINGPDAGDPLSVAIGWECDMSQGIEFIGQHHHIYALCCDQ